MRALSEWDVEYLDEIAKADYTETSGFEKKASAKFKLDSRGRPDGETKSELAKQVCAFANSGDGLLVYGIDQNRGVDCGVPAEIGRQPLSEWVEALIPKLHHPPIERCTARLVGHPSCDSDHGVLCISVPLSERRPHWTIDNEIAYLRVGAHSAPMRMQTLLDISSRGDVPRLAIAGLRLVRPTGLNPSPQTEFEVLPEVMLESGTICTHWVLELRLTSSSSKFHLQTLIATTADAFCPSPTVLYVPGNEPLFPRRVTLARTKVVSTRLIVGDDPLEVLVSLYAASTLPVERRFRFDLGSGASEVSGIPLDSR